jgi:hypothetical protein
MFGFGMTELIFAPLFLLFILIPIASLVLMILCLVDLLKSAFQDDTEKIVWLLLIIFMPLVGCILYIAIGKGRKIKNTAEIK